MANKYGILDTSDFEDNIAKLDIRDKIFELEPDETPFISILSKMTKLKCVDTRFSWFEDDMLGNYTTFSANLGSATTTTITVTSTAMFQEGDVVGVFDKDTNAGAAEEIMLIQTIISSTQLLVLRGWGETSAITTIIIGDYLYKLGSAMQEAYDAPESLVTEKTEVFNFVQLFSKTVMISDTAEQIDTYGGNRRNFERHKVAIELKRDLESQFLWGERKQDTTNSAHPRWQTRGVYKMLGSTAQSLDMGAASLAESAFEGWLKDVFTYGSSEKFLFSGALILSQISQFATGKQRLGSGVVTKYGVKVREYLSTMGTVNLVHDKHFLGPHAGKALILDMKELTYRYLQNSDFTLALNIQPKNAHYKLDEYKGTVGLELHHAAMHGVLEDVA